MRGARRGLVLLSLWQAVVVAQPLTWRGSPFFLSSQRLPLRTVLEALGTNYGLPVVVSPKISAQFTGNLQDQPPGSALAALARMYQLTPYYDGAALYLYKAEEFDRMLLTPASLSASALATMLSASGLTDPQACQVQTLAGSDALQIAGVPVCLTRLSTLARQLDEQHRQQAQSKESVTVLPLRYANAADTTYTYRNQSVVVPGVVSILRDMVRGRRVTAPAPAAAAGDAALPVFSADSRLNAVLVRDLDKNQALYPPLIAQLDRRPTLIDISMAIIDVDAADMNQLGVDWSGSAKAGATQIGLNTTRILGGGAFSSLVSNVGLFQVQLKALEESARARIISRPSVVTLENVAAVLDRNITFYTKLASDTNPKLESVTAGSLMRVTPRLIRPQAANAAVDTVLLQLNIQDGRQSPPVSDAESLPQVQNAEISTQATLQPGQALLLGGFVQEEAVQLERKVPLLGDLPLLGGLFRSKQKSGRSVVRLFLIKAEPRTL